MSAAEDKVGMGTAAQNLETLIQETVQAKQTELIELRGLKPSDTGKLSEHDEGRLRTTAFTFLVTKLALRLDDSEALEAIVDGGKDLGIDAIHWTEPNGSMLPITLVQTKLHKRMDGESNFSETVIDDMVRSIEVILNDHAKYTANLKLAHKIERIRNHLKRTDPQVRVILASNGIGWGKAGDDKIANADFGDDVKFEHIGPMEIHRIITPKPEVKGRLRLTGKYIHETFGQRQALVGRARLKDVAKMLEDCGDEVLDRNVRFYQGTQAGSVNSNIAETLNSKEVENFYFYNNGLTIVCDELKFSKPIKQNISISMANMQLINGGQTCKVVTEVLSKTRKDPEAYVLIRVHQIGKDDDQLVRNITYATNRQSSVNLADLQANDIRQEFLERSISDLGYRYRRKRSYVPLAEKEYSATEVARAVLEVWRGMAAGEKSEEDIFGKLYKKIFTNEINGAQAILAVRIMRTIGRFRNNYRLLPDFKDFTASETDTLEKINNFLDVAGYRLGKEILENVCSGQLKELNANKFLSALDMLESKGDALVVADYKFWLKEQSRDAARPSSSRSGAIAQ
ncbi:MAG TPA: AIPR family protein [Azospirillum sp.]|nr:AIPR family protein [Azospirillum sp.]